MTTPPTSQPPLLPPDPDDALTLENDIVGLRLWGPAGQPTLSLGRSDIWDRRWFADRQPLVTLTQVRELAEADRLAEQAATKIVFTSYTCVFAPGRELCLSANPAVRRRKAQQLIE